MSRNADEGFTVYEELFKRGVSLVFLKERHIDTATYRKALESSVPMTETAVDSKDFGGTLTDVECMKQTGLARNTFYKYKRELKAEAEA